MTRWLLLVVSCWFGTACSGAETTVESGALALNAFEFSEYCAETGAMRCERCRAEAEDERGECFRVCAALSERTGSSTCFASCEVPRASCDAECALAPDECAAPGFRFQPSLPGDASIEAVCTSANLRNQGCRQAPVRTDCEASGRLERPEAAAVYECLAELECGAVAKSCFWELGVSTFGESLAASCPSEPLDEALVSTVNRAAVWVLPEVLEDARVCSERACSERRFSACVQAWVGAL